MWHETFFSKKSMKGVDKVDLINFPLKQLQK